MSEKKYTVSLYIAPPGAIMIDQKTGEQKKSSVGHVYYAISEDGGLKKQGYGFSPKVSSPIWAGQVVENEHKSYQNPVYVRTLEISKEQYDKLKAFGEASKEGNISKLTNGKFSTSMYYASHNSCVDYVFHALRYSGIYDHQTLKPGSEINQYGERIYELVSDDGHINVVNNAAIFNKIPNQMNSKLNQIDDITPQEREKIPFYFKVENESTLSNSYLANLSPSTQKLIQQCDEQFTALCKRRGVTADHPDEMDNVKMAAAYTALNAGLTKIDKMDFGENRTLFMLSHEPHMKLASLSTDEAVNIPVSQSMANIHIMEQQNAQQVQERQMAQSQQQNQVRTIG